MGADQTNPMSFFKVHPSITGIVALNNPESSTQTFVYIYVYFKDNFFADRRLGFKKNNILLLLNVIFKKKCKWLWNKQSPTEACGIQYTLAKRHKLLGQRGMQSLSAIAMVSQACVGWEEGRQERSITPLTHTEYCPLAFFPYLAAPLFIHIAILQCLIPKWRALNNNKKILYRNILYQCFLKDLKGNEGFLHFILRAFAVQI